MTNTKTYETHETQFGVLPNILNGIPALVLTLIMLSIFLWAQLVSSATPEILMAVKQSIVTCQGTVLVLSLTLIYIPSSAGLLLVPIQLPALKRKACTNHQQYKWVSAL